MQIGLISDTRIPGGATEVPVEVIQAFANVDLILHAGGIHTPKVLDWLERIAPVIAVGRIQGGHVELPQPVALESEDDLRIAEQQILRVEGHTIGMVNNLELDGFNDDIFPGSIEGRHIPNGSLGRIIETFFGTPVDIVVFGRTLYHLVEEHQGILFINPGSPTLPRNLMKLGNVALLELSLGTRNVKLIDLDEFS